MYIGFEARPNICCDISYFAVPAFVSVGGRSLAAHVVQQFNAALPMTPTLRGMRLPVLRETQMPAVLCSMGPVREVVDATSLITRAIVEAARRWGDGPLPMPDA
jgi:N-acetylmuramoyl-L-alanine amidase